MKLKNTTTRLSRVITGAAMGAAIFAASALQAQTPGPVPGAPPAAAPDNSNVSHKAKEFIKDAAQANQTEIAMSNVAESKSQNPTVKQLAQMMRDDHQKNYAELQTLAQAHGVEIAAAPDWMNQREINHLQKATEADLDKEYTKIMLKDHVKTIKCFNKAVAEIQDADVKQYAQNTLPKLREHLRHSEDAARSVGVEESTINSILKELPNEDRGVTLR